MINNNIFDGLVVPTIEELIDRCRVPHVVSVERDCIVLGNVSCVGSDGKVFERYGELRVDKDVVRGPDLKQVDFMPYRAAVHFEGQGMFLPSMALSCNILKVLYESRDDEEVSRVLMQYKDNGRGYGWHAQNTLVDWGSKKIIHYPRDSDFPSDGGSDNINQGKNRLELKFNSKRFKDMYLEEALKIDNFKAFAQDLTGLQQPETLVEIGKRFSKPACIWTSSRNDVRAAWLGGDYYLGIFAGNPLDYDIASRGVRSP